MRLLAILIVCVATTAHADPINAVIGDVSWTRGDPEAATEHDRIATHLRYVLGVLRQRDGGAQRAALLDELETYIAQGMFSRRTDDTYAGRRPRFIDDRGVHCAVGFLIARSDHDELAHQLDAQYEYAYVAAMQSPELAAWAREHGFTIDELAMIQPEYGPPDEQRLRWDVELKKREILLACNDHKPLVTVDLHYVGHARLSRPRNDQDQALDACRETSRASAR